LPYNTLIAICSIIEISEKMKVYKNSNRCKLYVTVQNLFTGFEYAVTEKTKFTMSFTGYKRKWDMSASSRNIYEPLFDTILYTKRILWEVNKWKSESSGLGLRHYFNDNQELYISLDYLYYHNDQKANYQIIPEIYTEPETEFVNSIKKTPINFWIGIMDYSIRISSRFIFETGIKGTLSEFKNNVEVNRKNGSEHIIDETFTNNSALNEKIFAAYSLLKWSSQNNWSFQGGIRYEFTDTQLSEGLNKLVDRKYGSFFPGLTITNQFNNANSLQLTYNRRINRPTYNEMAPFVFFLGLHTFVAGNLSLKPAISDGLGITYKWKRLWLKLGYDYTKDDIVSYQPSVNESANSIIYRSENLDYNRSYSLSTSFPLKITSWWNMQNDFSFFHNKIETNYLKENITDQNISASLNSMMNITLPRNYSFEVTGQYYSPIVNGISKVFNGGFLNIGIRK
jgi:hypothetical protein